MDHQPAPFSGGQRTDTRGRVGTSLSRLGALLSGAASTNELGEVLSLTMQAIQTAARLGSASTPRDGKVVEVAAGRPYQLSSALGSECLSGVVAASDDHFFHTGFGPGQSIRIDLGRTRRVRRIEISNRRSGRQDRARHLFAVLSTPRGQDRVFPMFKRGALPDGSWREIGIDVPDVRTRYVTITSPVATALHFADLRVYAVADGRQPGMVSSRQSSPAPAGAQRRAAARAEPAPPKSMDVVQWCATHRIPIRGLIHVGANRADEYDYYASNTQGPLLFIEAIPELVETVRRRLDPSRPHYVRQAAVAESSGTTVSFNIASNSGLSSSLLKLGRHAEICPWITYTDTIEVVTERLDDIVAGRHEAGEYNVLVLDVQGAELKVLQGAPELLNQIDAVVAEISPEPLYEGGCTFLEVTTLLAEAGLVFRDVAMKPRGWGDAFYTTAAADAGRRGAC